jgi:hypothetical protein
MYFVSPGRHVRTYHALLDAGLEPRERADLVGVEIQPARRSCKETNRQS